MVNANDNLKGWKSSNLDQPHGDPHGDMLRDHMVAPEADRVLDMSVVAETPSFNELIRQADAVAEARSAVEKALDSADTTGQTE